MQFRRTAIRVTLAQGELTVAALDGATEPVRVGYRDDVRELRGGERCTFRVEEASVS